MRLIFQYNSEKEFINLQAGNRSLNRANQSVYSEKLTEMGADIESPDSVSSKS